MIVLDASAALELLLNTGRAPTIAEVVFTGQQSIHAPHLLDLEVAQVLRRLEQSGELDGNRAAQVFEDLADLGITRYPHAPLMPTIWSLRNNVTADDAAYLALGLALDATVVTCDKALGSVSNVGRVQVIR